MAEGSRVRYTDDLLDREFKVAATERADLRAKVRRDWTTSTVLYALALAGIVLLVSLVVATGPVFASLAGLLAGCALVWREAKNSKDP